jgi:hypothetical protein
VNRRVLASVLFLGLAGCASSVEVLSSAPAIGGQCDVTVYQTRALATAQGDIEELCIINGSSSGSFRHTVATAIDKHKDEACACGATNVYVEDRSDSGLSVATVTLVAFRYTN